MIRQILRNIQYSLLLFALLFVFLAFFHPMFVTYDIDAFSKWWDWDYNDQPHFFTSPSSLYASSSTTASTSSSSSSSSNAAQELRGSSSSGEVKTVSYMVAIPPPLSMSMEDCKRQDKIWMDRGAVLQTSIQLAHKGTRYHYRIYALQQQHHLQEEEEESGLSNCTESNVATIVSSLGYDILKAGDGAWWSSSSGAQKGDVIVHLSLDSIVLRPFHHLFDKLLLDQQRRTDVFFPPSAVSQETKVLNSFFAFQSSHKLLMEEYVRWISHYTNRWNDDAGNTTIGNGIDISAKTFFEDPTTESYSRNIRAVPLDPCAYYHNHNINHVGDYAVSYDKRNVTETITINHDPLINKRSDRTVSLNEDCDISSVLVATFATTTKNEKQYKDGHPIGTSTCPMPWRCPQQQSSLLITNNHAPQTHRTPTKPVSKFCNNLHQSWLSMHKRRFTTTTTTQKKKAGSSDDRINHVNIQTDPMEDDSLDYDCNGFENKG